MKFLKLLLIGLTVSACTGQTAIGIKVKHSELPYKIGKHKGQVSDTIVILVPKQVIIKNNSGDKKEIEVGGNSYLDVSYGNLVYDENFKPIPDYEHYTLTPHETKKINLYLYYKVFLNEALKTKTAAVLDTLRNSNTWYTDYDPIDNTLKRQLKTLEKKDYIVFYDDTNTRILIYYCLKSSKIFYITEEDILKNPTMIFSCE